MRYYLEFVALHSRFFSDTIRPGVLNDQVLKRMIACCVQGRKFTYVRRLFSLRQLISTVINSIYFRGRFQAGILCQYLEDVDKYHRAFQCLQDRGCCDASDQLYHMVWDVTILEFLINLHSRRGEEVKMLQAVSINACLVPHFAHLCKQ